MFRHIIRQIKRLLKIRVRFWLTSALSNDDRRLIKKIRQRKLTYLSMEKLASLAITCHEIERAHLTGSFIEAGCALGGSTILLSTTKSIGRELFVYDVFGMIPPPTGNDTQDVHSRYSVIESGRARGIRGDTYYGYQDNLMEAVNKNLRDFGIDSEYQSVFLIKGLVQDTMDIHKPVAFAHIDVDWFDPVMTCLTRIFPHLIVGGSIIIDDYYDWGGCRKATDMYLARVPRQFILNDSAGSLKITRIASG